MTLQEWVERKGKGALSRLKEDTRLAYTTILRVHRGEGANLATLRKIEKATDGAVTVAEMASAVRDPEPGGLRPTGSE